MLAGPRIRVLPSTLADQIAAGEVIERPASVVKELCENSIDAGATRVEVEIESGGRQMIRIVDDGSGMTAEEARLAMLRHATSKIVAADDLWGLRTFGFRGEALPSISAVSRLSLRTRVPGEMAGFQIFFEAGTEVSSGEVGMPEGTHIEVRDLFFNTPARLKFLKSETTESAAVAETMLRLALANPSVHFRFRNNGRQALDLPPHRDLPERVRAALAKRGAGLLHEARGQEAGVEVRAFLAPPEEASTTPRSTLLFVGRRFVRDRALLHSLCMGYGEILERGRYPLAALFVEVPGEELDINVHPQKLEVRFARPQEVLGAVRHIVAAAVARAPWLSEGTQAYTLPPDTTDRFEKGAAEIQGAYPLPGPARPPGISSAGSRGVKAAFEAKREALFHAPSMPIPLSSPRAEPLDPEGYYSRLVQIGTVLGRYLICEGERAMVVVDMQEALERILVERLQAAYAKKDIPKHRLLFPIPIELPDDETTAVASDPVSLTQLENLGFDMEGFGPQTLLLRAIPEILKEADPKPLVLDVLAELHGEHVAALPAEHRHSILAAMARHAALRPGDLISPEYVRSVLVQLDALNVVSPSSQGRALSFQMPLAEMQQRLRRI